MNIACLGERALHLEHEEEAGMNLALVSVNVWNSEIAHKMYSLFDHCPMLPLCSALPGGDAANACDLNSSSMKTQWKGISLMDAIRRFELNLHATNASLPPSPHSHQASIFLTPETPPPANADTAAFQELENIGRLSFLVDMGFRTVVSEFFAWMTKTGWVCAHALLCPRVSGQVIFLLDPETPPPASADTAAVQEREK